MISEALWILIFMQIALGAVDTLVHHEGVARLAWRPTQKRELQLHGARNILYAVVFILLGFVAARGVAAGLLGLVLAVEVLVTLWDFVEEDRTRALPASERVLHTVMALNYGAILAMLAPLIASWSMQPTGVSFETRGVWSLLCAAAAVGVALFGLRDLAAARRCARIAESPAGPLACGLKARSRILVAGATGFVGTRLVSALVDAGHEVTALTRDAKKAAQLPAPLRVITDLTQIANDETFDAIVNLAGEPVSNGVWTAAKRARIIESRVSTNDAIVRLIKRLRFKPDCYIAASAVGWYGLRDDAPLTEREGPRPCFSHESCEAVETAARGAELFGVRVVRLRIGLVLAADGGLLARMLTPFEFGLGGPFGDGRQMMSWITRDDLVRLIVYGMRNSGLTGAVNATAPGAVSNRHFAASLGRALGRPAPFAIPAAPLAFLLGDFARELLLSGQNVRPEKALAAGFVFADPSLEQALRKIVGAPKRASTTSLSAKPALAAGGA